MACCVGKFLGRCWKKKESKEKKRDGNKSTNLSDLLPISSRGLPQSPMENDNPADGTPPLPHTHMRNFVLILTISRIHGPEVFPNFLAELCITLGRGATLSCARKRIRIARASSSSCVCVSLRPLHNRSVQLPSASSQPLHPVPNR